MKKIVLIGLLCLCQMAIAKKTNASDILGYWLSESGSAVVKIEKAQDDTYEGKIVWIKRLHTGEKKQILDDNNPKKELRSRSVLNLKNLTGFTFDGKNKWKGGKIYDPKKGKTYAAKMELDDEDANILRLRGFVGIPLFGRTTKWTRQKQAVPDQYLQ